MKTTIQILCILLINSCASQKQCLRKYPPQTSTITIKHDSIITEIKYRDTTLYVKIPGETITNTVFVPVSSPGQNYIPDTARAENKYSIAKAFLDWPKIRLNLIQKPQTLEFDLQNAITERNTYKMLWEKEKSKEVVTVKFVPKIVKYFAGIGIGFIIAFLAWAFMRLKKVFKF